MLAIFMAGAGTAQAADIQCREDFSRDYADFNLVLDLETMTIGLPNPHETGSLINLLVLNETPDEIMAARY